MNITYIKTAFDSYGFIKGSINIGNYYTDGLFAIIFVLCVFALALYTLRDNGTETIKAFSVALYLSFGISLLFLLFGEIEAFVVTIIGIITALIIVYQKISDN